MDLRTKSILINSVEDFIKTGNLITSNRLYESHDFGIKPAMIRRELSELDKMGFLEQFRLSGGRQPTDKAYKYLVKCLMEDEDCLAEVDSSAESFLKKIGSSKHDEFVKDLSEYSRALSVFYNSTSFQLYNNGLGLLFKELDFVDKKEIESIINDFELLPLRLERAAYKWQKVTEWPRVFIGQSPVTNSCHLSVVAAKVVANEENVFVMNIGSKRMNYARVLSVFKSLSKVTDA